MALNAIGLLGGSFDPVHRAHIALAKAALQALSLRHVELIPAAQPWQRVALGASPKDRLRMLRLACTDEPRVRVNPIELQRGGTTYTVDTLRALEPDKSYVWILGADQLENFCTWHRWCEILRYVRLAVAQRPGGTVEPPPALAACLTPGEPYVIPFAPDPVSASDIRKRLARGATVDDMLDARVLEHIRTHHLYQNAADDDDLKTS